MRLIIMLWLHVARKSSQKYEKRNAQNYRPLADWAHDSLVAVNTHSGQSENARGHRYHNPEVQQFACKKRKAKNV